MRAQIMHRQIHTLARAHTRTRTPARTHTHARTRTRAHMRSASVALRFHLRARQVNHRCRLNSFELGKWAVLKRSTVVVLNR